MKYRTKSADVLNEADRFQRILDWQLFVADQEIQLWGPNKETNWVPGDAIHAHPKHRQNFYPGMPDWYNFGSGQFGNYTRPMFQTIEYADRTLGEFVESYSRWQLVVGHERVRCEPCGVSWTDGDECWICGESYPRPIRKVEPVRFYNHRTHERIEPMGSIFDVEETDGGLRAHITFNLEPELAEGWREFMNEQLRHFSTGFRNVQEVSGQRVGRSMRGMLNMMQILDEISSVGPPVFRGGIREQVPVTEDDTCPLEPTGTDGIVVVPPVVPTIVEINEWFETSVFDTTVRGWVEIPDDVDLSGRTLPQEPRMPEPRDWSTWEHRPRYGPPTTPFRRTR